MDRLVIVWRVTERCNLGCRFCAYDAHLRRPRRAFDAAEALRFGRLVAEWARGRDVLVSWLGGEPFLWPPLADVTADLRDRGLRIALTTNGRALADVAWARWCADSLDEITVSLDGDAAFHDWARDRAGSAAEVLAGLRRLSGPLVRVNTVLMRGNVDGFEALCEAVADAGADELTFNQLGGNDRPEFWPANRLRPEDVERFADRLPGVRERMAARGLRIAGDPAYLHRLRCSARDERVPVDDCAPGRRFWFVEIDGAIAPCSFTAEGYGVPIGGLTTPAHLDALPARFAELRRQTRVAACLDCHSTRVFAKFEAAPPGSAAP